MKTKEAITLLDQPGVEHVNESCTWCKGDWEYRFGDVGYGHYWAGEGSPKWQQAELDRLRADLDRANKEIELHWENLGLAATENERLRAQVEAQGAVVRAAREVDGSAHGFDAVQQFAAWRALNLALAALDKATTPPSEATEPKRIPLAEAARQYARLHPCSHADAWECAPYMWAMGLDR